MKRTLETINKTFNSALNIQPEIRVNETVVYTQTAPIAELAVVSKEQLIEYTYLQSKKWLGQDVLLSHKKITVHAIYLLKAGFNLREPFVVSVDQETRKIEAELPRARILSVEQISAPKLASEAELFNPVTDEERQAVLDGLDASARHAAESSGLMEDAEKQALQRLQEISEQNGQNIIFRWRKIALP